MDHQYRKPVFRSEAQRNQYEIHNLHERSTKVTNETVSKTRNMLRLVNECKDTGANTLQELQAQGEQLDRTEQALDRVDDHVANAEVRLSNIEKGNAAPCCCLPCVSCCQKDPDKIKRKKKKKKDKVITLKNKDDSSDSDGSVGKLKNGKGGGERERFFPKVLGTTEEDEIERNLDDVSKHVSHLKAIATNMDLEVSQQNEQLDRMNDKAERSLARINTASKRADDINHDRPRTKKCWCC